MSMRSNSNNLIIIILESLSSNRELILQLARREITSRYTGSFFGLAWSIINPLLLLLVYTFVFSVIFKTRWNLEGTTNHGNFALVLFIGMILHTLIAEVLSQAPNKILQNINYVKKVVFPLEILNVVSVLSALVHAFISFTVLIIAVTIFNGMPPFSIILLPIIVFPFALLTLGISWILSSLGVFFRDLSQIIGIFITALMFLAPIFYPISALPRGWQSYVYLNPLTFPIEQSRAIILFSKDIEWQSLFNYSAVSLVIFLFGFWWHLKTRDTFADVL
jgi:lipopolysaccharide transport system permease protein